MSNDFQKILVINVNWVGDVVFSSAVFEALHEAYPKAQISCLAPPRVQEVIQSISFVNEIIVYEEKGYHKTPWGKWKLINELRCKKFDAAFILHRSLTRALFTFLAGIPIRVGYQTKGRKMFLTHSSPEPAGIIHRQNYYLGVLEAFGIPVKSRESRLVVDPELSQRMNNLLSGLGVDPQDFLIVLNPGGNWDLKRWPRENYTRLIEQILEHLNSQERVKIILNGAQKDIPLVEEILSPLTWNHQHKIINLVGRLNLRELMALMKRANLVVSADSGPLHIASSVGAKTIGIFGPTSPQITGPRGQGLAEILKVDVGCNRSPCYFLLCPENTCMQAVTVQDVFEEVLKIIN